MELVTLVGLAAAIANAPPPDVTDWLRCAILAGGATIHIQLTHRQEERRRNRTRTVLIDLTAVWVFPAAIILPVPLALLVVGLVRVQRWFIARRPAHNFVFSSITHGAAATLAHLTFGALGAPAGSPIIGIEALWEFGAFVIAGLVYEAVQVAYIGGILALGAAATPTVRNVLGSKADNLLEAVTIGLGAVTAILLVTVPPAVGIMAVVTVVFNRLAEIDQLQNDVRTDSKTGVYNMRGWSERAERALARAGRSGNDVALLMLDLDHFKWINDTFGHPAGDDVLIMVAQALSEVTRPSDVIGRFGGEEFLLLLPDTDSDTAIAAAERVRQTIGELKINTTDKRGSQTVITGRTASIGVAVYPKHADTLDSLLHAADRAVYAAKEAGRDQVSLASAERNGT
ncbi:GGDEF domain-containing protein [Amycolatopsis aidingensis]|uniref:GGDEF domain-containing protein n=1 Tax=Amycolatopsis aidingensis TaxID=2842453 RepID=UPI001C0BBE6B|nr:GGDEF domain-containing protein [Amycolatopsis aidingensis]